MPYVKQQPSSRFSSRQCALNFQDADPSTQPHGNLPGSSSNQGDTRQLASIDPQSLISSDPSTADPHVTSHGGECDSQLALVPSAVTERQLASDPSVPFGCRACLFACEWCGKRPCCYIMHKMEIFNGEQRPSMRSASSRADERGQVGHQYTYAYYMRRNLPQMPTQILCLGAWMRPSQM